MRKLDCYLINSKKRSFRKPIEERITYNNGCPQLLLGFFKTDLIQKIACSNVWNVGNITQLLIFIKANTDIFQPENVSIKTIRYPSDSLDESTIQAANILEPIVLAEISPDRFNVIDGHHRLEKAYREGRNNILAYKINAEQHIKFLTSVESYEEYIIYWNLKIRQYSHIPSI